MEKIAFGVATDQLDQLRTTGCVLVEGRFHGAVTVACTRRFAHRLAGLMFENDRGALADARLAARRIHAFGCRAVVVKGGHLSTDDAVDVL